MEKTRVNIIVGILRIGAFLQREGDRIVKDFDLNQQQYVVLNHIYTHQPLNHNDICSRLLYEKSNISKMLKKLVDLGYVVQIKSRTDKRYVDITCTNKGVAVITQGNKLFDEYNSKLLSMLSSAEIQATENLINNLQNQIK